MNRTTWTRVIIAYTAGHSPSTGEVEKTLHSVDLPLLDRCLTPQGATADYLGSLNAVQLAALAAQPWARWVSRTYHTDEHTPIGQPIAPEQTTSQLEEVSDAAA